MFLFLFLREGCSPFASVALDVVIAKHVVYDIACLPLAASVAVDLAYAIDDLVHVLPFVRSLI